MKKFHSGDKVVVAAPPNDGHPHNFDGQEGALTAVSTSAQTAQVLFPGTRKSITIPLAFLELADEGLAAIIASVSRIHPAGWTNLSGCEDYHAYRQLVAGLGVLTTMA